MAEENSDERQAIRWLGLVLTAALLGSGFLGAGPSVAQDPAASVNVAGCLELAGEQERRQCIDAQVDAFLAGRDGATESASSPRDAGVTDSPGSGVAESAAIADSGTATAGAENEEFFGTIVELHERLPSAYVITLDNGQVWEQTEPKRFPLRPGLEVRIYPTGWGTRHRLSGIGTGGHIQVRRLR